MSYEHPSVYITTYSNIDVYECLVDDAPIMRRCKDDWVNATQILKLCNFPKAKRTKILEKGVQQGQHEKVQGGYGRFQGTWIPLPNAQNLAKEYGLPDERLPVLYIDVDDPSVVIPKKLKPGAFNKDGTPVKRKYGKRPKKEDTPKKMKFDENLPPSSVFTHDYPQSVNRNDPSMAPMGHNNMHMMPVGMNNSQLHMPHMPPTFPQQQYVSNGVNGNYNRQSFQGFPMPGDNSFNQQQVNVNESYNKNNFMDDSRQAPSYGNRKGVSSQSTNETNWSQEEAVRDSDTSMSSTEIKNGKGADDDRSHAAQLLRFFSEDNAPVPYFLYNPPPDFNINEAIDDEGHSTLHWAASIGKLNLVQLILYRGANPLVFSNYGLNSLSKCISFNNCYDLKNFPQILDALETCLINTDINGRTPLHYLAQFSKVRSKLPALSYYVNIIFNKLRMMSNNNKGSGVDLMKNVIDHQDVNGDTCLHLASRAGCTYLIKFFLSNGARDDLLNVNNETAKSIIMQQDLVVYNFDRMDAHSLQPQQQENYDFPQLSQQDLQDHHQLQHGVEEDNMPQFTITDMAEEKDSFKRTPVTHSLGTPIRTSTRKVDTPDTQRTTIQDEEVEELHDRVSKEHLKTLLERQAGTVEENKENIFVDELSKANHDAMSTPKTTHNSNFKSSVLGVITEKKDDVFNKKAASPAGDLTPHPPQLDKRGTLVTKQGEEEPAGVKLPMQDVASMMHGMINSLSTSYEQELNGLTLEYERIKKNLAEKREQDSLCSERVRKLLNKSGFEQTEKLEDASLEVQQETSNFEQVLKHKEVQLSCSIERLQAFELANAVQDQEGKITEISQEAVDQQELWALSIELSKVQVQRNELVKQIAQGVKEFAVSSKMNKYRKLISLSCGLRVEDIDGIIDGIQESLSGGSM